MSDYPIVYVIEARWKKNAVEPPHDGEWHAVEGGTAVLSESLTIVESTKHYLESYQQDWWEYRIGQYVRMDSHV